MNILVIFDHPRRDSFCGAVLNALMDGLAEAGHRAELADLRAEGFDPRLPVGDEPDWDDAGRRCWPSRRASRATRRWPSYFRSGGGRSPRPQRAGSTASGAMAGPMAAVSCPSARRCSSAPPPAIRKATASAQLLTGTMSYCGIPESELHLLYDVMDGDANRREHLATARRLGAEYFGRSTP